MGLYSGGLIIARTFASEIWGDYFFWGGGVGAYYRNFTVSLLSTINFCARSLDTTHHVVQNLTTGIRRYTPSDLKSVTRFYKQVQNKRRKSSFQVYLFDQITVLKKYLNQSTCIYFNRS